MSVANVSVAPESSSTVLRGVSRKGHPLILYKGYKYGIRKQFVHGNIKWICTLSKCSGSVLTDKDLKVFQEIGVHNHLPAPPKTQDRLNFRPVDQSIEELKPPPSALPQSQPGTSWDMVRPPSPHSTDVSLMDALKQLSGPVSPIASFTPGPANHHTKLYAALIMPNANPTTPKINGYHPDISKLGGNYFYV